MMPVARNLLESIKIIAFATIAAVLYGIIHDQVTAHVCVEYFTIAHPPVFATRSPFLLALGWGVIATWWVGLPLGVGLRAAARTGPACKLGLVDLHRPILLLMLVSAVCAFGAGLSGGILVAHGIVPVPAGWAEAIPADKYAAFTADAWAHAASYASGALGGLFVIGHTVWRRTFGVGQG